MIKTPRIVQATYSAHWSIYVFLRNCSNLTQPVSELQRWFDDVNLSLDKPETLTSVSYQSSVPTGQSNCLKIDNCKIFENIILDTIRFIFSGSG